MKRLLLFVVLWGITSPGVIFAQQFINGTVYSTEGGILEGASLTCINSRISTRTDTAGNFRIQIPVKKDTLLITHVGYQPQRLAVIPDDRNTLKIQLRPDNNKLQEVEVNTGYYRVPVERATGSFVQVDNALLNRSVSSNILDRLEGVTNGLLFDRRNLEGEDVNGAPELRIRGLSTIEAKLQGPLIIIDNFPYEGDINNLNPNMVESVTLLRDAAASSIWGARAGNGVIVITTKQGQYHQTARVALNSNISISEKPDLLYSQNYLPAPTVMEIQNELFERAAYAENDQTYIPSYVELLIKRRNHQIEENEFLKEESQMRNTDLRQQAMDYLYHQGVTQQYALNMMGGGDTYRYSLAGGYDNNQASVTGNRNTRLNLSLQNTFKVNPSLEINGGLWFTQQEGKNNGLNYRTVGLGPMGSIYERLVNPDGGAAAFVSAYRASYREQAESLGLLDWMYRPLEEVKQTDRTNKARELRLTGGAAYSFLSDFRLQAVYQYNLSNTSAQAIFDKESYYVRNLVNRFTQNDGSRIIPYAGIFEYAAPTENQGHSGRLQLDFNRDFSAVHQVSALAGAEIRQGVDIRTSGQTLYNYDTDLWTSSSLYDYKTSYPVRPTGRAQIPNTSFSPAKMTNRYLSYFGNASYTILQKYILSGSLRWDGSNLLGVKTNQRGTALWSLGGSWELSKEHFYSFAEVIPYLRLRSTYGSAGNIDKSQSYYATISVSNNEITHLPESDIIHPGNPSLRWEQVNIANLGLDWRTNNQRINGSLEYYVKEAKHLLGENMMDPTTGINMGSIYKMNYGNLRTGGWDLQLNSRNLIGDFSWGSTLLLSQSKNEITYYNGPENTIVDYIYNSPIIKGESVDLIYAFPWYGLSPEDGMPVIHVNGETTTDVTKYADYFSNFPLADIVMAGTRVPVIFGSLRNSFNIKAFEVSALISFKFGHVFRRNSIGSGQEYLTTNQVLHMDYFKRWVRPGDERFTDVPAWAETINPSQRNDLYLYSEALITKGDVIRLQDISINYTLHRKLSGHLPFQRLKVYGYARNLGILWRANKNGIDPDYPNADFPAPASFAVGLQMDF